MKTEDTEALGKQS